jgi:hypothetical protein
MKPKADLQALSTQKRLLLKKLMARRGVTGAPSGDPIAARADGSPAPLSFLQEGMWFLDQLNPGSAHYNVPMAARLAGPLDASTLQQALEAIVQRHESLRTSLQLIDGIPMQVIARPDVFRLIQTDLSELAPEERRQRSLQLAAEEARTPFDLDVPPLMRAHLVRLAADDHLLLITIHHIVTDGWSMGVLTRELAVLYEALNSGQPPDLPELPVQFGDYARWQRGWLSETRLGSLLDFWRRALASHDFILELPTDFPRPALQSGHGGHLPFSLEEEHLAALKAWSSADDVSLFAVMLAVFAVLLAAISGQDDIIVGTPIANRNRSELENLVGYFVNLLPLRTRLQPGDSLRKLARQVHRMTQAANEHQELPFGKLVEALQPQRDPGRNPIFQVEFTLLDPAHSPPVYGYGFRSPVRQAIRLGGLTLTPLEVESEASKFDLTVLLWDMGDRIGGTFEYDAALFRPESITNLAEQYAGLLERAAAAPDLTVEALIEALGDLQTRQKTEDREARRAAGSKKIKNIRRKKITVKEK